MLPQGGNACARGSWLLTTHYLHAGYSRTVDHGCGAARTLAPVDLGRCGRQVGLQAWISSTRRNRW